MTKRALWLSVLALGLLAGCADSQTSTDPADPTPGADAQGSEQSPAKKSAEAAEVAEELPSDLPADQQRANMAGSWFLLVTVRDGETYVALLDVAQGGGEPAEGAEAATPESPSGAGYSVELVEAAAPFAKWTLKEHEVTDNSVRLKFSVEGSDVTIDYTGTLREGIVYGTLQAVASSLDTARMVPTQEASIAPYTSAIPAPGRSAWQAALKESDSFAALRKFCAENPKSPLALQMYNRLLSGALGTLSDHVDAQGIEELAAGYVQAAALWGPRIEAVAKFNIGAQLCTGMLFPEIGLRFVDEFEQSAPADMVTQFKSTLEYARSRARLAQARAKAASAVKLISAGQEQAGAQLLAEVSQQYPYDPIITFAAAKQALNKNKVDEALKLYGRLTAVPLLQGQLQEDEGFKETGDDLPSQTFELLWKAKHGNTDGLDDFIDSIYLQSVEQVLAGVRQPGPEKTGTRTLLCELFTGAQCAPCVAADLATRGLDEAYATTNGAIVLRHHLHNPGPDPLTSEDSERRFLFSMPEGQTRGTPVLVLNGLQRLIIGGMFEDVPRIYRTLRETIDPLLAADAEIQLQLSADLQDGQLKIQAEATGVDPAAGDLRLVLFIVEEEVKFAAPNGIRRHEMVVRSMLSGPEGIPPSDGNLRFADSLVFDEFKAELEDYLTAYEAKHPGVTFPTKPMELKSLRLVACVQNHETREVLQAAMVPVTAGEEVAVREPVPAQKPGTE